MRKLILSLFFLFITTQAFAVDYWVFIRTYDRSGTDALNDAGRSKAGDVVQIRPAVAGQTPTAREKAEWCIVTVSNIPNDVILSLTQQMVDQNGLPIAFRKDRINFQSLGLTVGFYPNAISYNSIKNKIVIKTAMDLRNYKFKQLMYAYIQRPLEWVDNLITRRAFATVSTFKVAAVGSNMTTEDYNTFTACEDANDGNLVGTTTQVNCEGYNDDGAIADSWDVNGSTTNATYYMRFAAASGEYHTGIANTGVLVTHTTTGQYNTQVTVRNQYTVIEWLDFRITMDHMDTNCINTFQATDTTPAAPLYRNNIIHRVGGSTGTRQSGIIGSNNGGASKIYNNIIIGFTWGINIDRGSALLIYNNTIKGSTIGVNAANGTYTATIKNHLSIGDTTAFKSDVGDSSSINNLAEDSTAHFGSTYTTGTTTATTANKLVNSGASFVTNGVQVGSVITNTTDSTYTYVTAVDSETQLSVANDIFTSGENYSVYKSYRGSVTCVDKTNNDLHLVSGDTNAIDRASDLGTTESVQYDIDNYDRDSNNVTWDIGADEYVSAATRRVSLTQ